MMAEELLDWILQALYKTKQNKTNRPADTSWIFAWGRPTSFDTWWVKSEIVGVTFPFF